MDIDEAVKRKERLERLKRARESTVGDTGFLEQAIENLEANGFRVRRAGDAAEAVQAVLEELIVTSCPWCEQNLADSMVGSEYRAEVKDILELVEESRIDKPYPG